MNKNHIFKLLFLTICVAVSLQVEAGNIDVATARQTANNFINKQVAAGLMKANRAGGLTLAFAEASSKVSDANDYYAFNIDGGGWVIIAGEDRATPVLGYGAEGSLMYDRLPCAFKALLNSYKREIEFLQTYTADDLVTANTPPFSNGVGPLITTTWGQEMPYYLQCPVYNNEYCVVGCVATAMAQVMYYWQYPQESGPLSSYYCYDIGATVGSLPQTSFNYNQMLKSYCHWDYDNSVLVQDSYTEVQAYEVAKLSRYCGQAVEMGYSPEGSGAYTSDQLVAMKNFGYQQTAEEVTKSWWGYDYYTTAEWETMMKTELNAGRPILYAANDPNAGGHAFICDGYRSDGKFHFNFGWYGTCDGWYVSTALNMVHRSGEELHFNSGHEMLIGVEPPEGWEPPTPTLAGDLDGSGEVDVTDVNILINIILGRDQAENYGTRAYITNDEDVDVSDVNALINIILNAD